jgi:hypothetical protein
MAGTTVASHYIFFDPGTVQTIFGTVNFDSNVVGIITSTGHLAASDFLANTGVETPPPEVWKRETQLQSAARARSLSTRKRARRVIMFGC